MWCNAVYLCTAWMDVMTPHPPNPNPTPHALTLDAGMEFRSPIHSLLDTLQLNGALLVSALRNMSNVHRIACVSLIHTSMELNVPSCLSLVRWHIIIATQTEESKLCCRNATSTRGNHFVNIAMQCAPRSTKNTKCCWTLHRTSLCASKDPAEQTNRWVGRLLLGIRAGSRIRAGAS